MKIITISREFGSGGRELGKRLADLLGFDYYDREIIEVIAGRQGMDEVFVEKKLDSYVWKSVPLTFRHSFSGAALLQSPQIGLLLEQKKVIEGIAAAGRDCVIVGRNADVILKAYLPFSMFVCSNMEKKVHRCMERAGEGENLSEREIRQNIRRIDKNRSRVREILTDSKWGECGSYHFTVNTADWNIKELARAVAGLSESWFGRGR